jgi:hypothetical protein
MELDSIGRLLLVLGAGVMVSGGLLLLVSRIPGINQLFNLPGDIRIETSGFSCFFPIVSMILISLVLTIVINVVIRLLNR